MGGEQARQPDTVAEQHVAHFLGFCALLEARALLHPGDLFQRAGDALRLAGELHRRRIRQYLARAAHAGLDHPAEEDADVADHDRHQRRDQHRGCPALARTPAEHQDLAADQAQRQDPEQNAHQADVQAHVAVEDVAVLVGDHALQLVAVELVQGAAGDRHRRVGWGISGGERVDRRLLLHHEDRRHGHAGRDRHLLDHVAQPPQLRIDGVLGHRHPAHLHRHRRPTAAQRGDAVQRGQADDAAGDDRGAGQQTWIGADHGRHRQAGRADDAHHRQREQHDQPGGVPARLLLALEEIQNCTFGASRTSARSAGMSSSAAASKLNMPAMTLDGNTSRLLL